MYYMTGLPGWIRFGFSPGWLGRSPTGLPPTAQWLMASGLLPQYLTYLGTVAPATAAAAPTVTPPVTPTPTLPTFPTIPKEQEKAMLEQQLKFLEAQVDAIRKRLEELAKGG